MDTLRKKLNEALVLADGIRVAPQIDPAFTQQTAGTICGLIQEAIVHLGAERIENKRNKARA